jgi:hypothetical protein
MGLFRNWGIGGARGAGAGGTALGHVPYDGDVGQCLLRSAFGEGEQGECKSPLRR